jgi:PqqA peptide cyclase
MTLAPPLGVLAELTHRCPLGCAYCSNPVELDRRSDELGTADWLRVFEEAAALGVLHLHLSGGEPTARRDLAELVAGAAKAGLYTNLITSGIGLDARRLESLKAAGLDHIQLSIQGVEEDEADRIAGYPGAQREKRKIAAEVVRLGLPLTINLVVHRSNAHCVEASAMQAVAMGATRLEVAHAQYQGWALANRAALLPSLEQAKSVRRQVESVRARTAGSVVIDYVTPDYFARFPKPCMNGWGRRSLNVTPRGRVLPCHAAEFIPGLEFWSVRDRSLREIWEASPAFGSFRGTEWMREPCRTCPRQEIDFGGCRCQAFALTGDARNADPVCELSPRHEAIVAAVAAASGEAALTRRGYAAAKVAAPS